MSQGSERSPRVFIKKISGACSVQSVPRKDLIKSLWAKTAHSSRKEDSVHLWVSVSIEKWQSKASVFLLAMKYQKRRGNVCVIFFLHHRLLFPWKAI